MMEFKMSFILVILSNILYMQELASQVFKGSSNKIAGLCLPGPVSIFWLLQFDF